MSKSLDNQHDYDFALSFAGEDREYVEQVAEALRLRGLSVFYDKFEEANLLGKNLFDYLSDLYQNRAQFCVMFVSSSYADKLWTNVERKAAQAGALSKSAEYVIPVMLEQVEIPGLLPTVGYASKREPPELASLLVEKLYLRTEVSHQSYSNASDLAATANRIKVYFPSITTLDTKTLKESFKPFALWSKHQLHGIPVVLRLPKEIDQWLDYCQSVVDTDIFREAPREVQDKFLTFVRENSEFLIPRICQAVGYFIRVFGFDDEDKLCIPLSIYVRSQLVMLIRRILSLRLKGMRSAKWLDHFRMFDLYWDNQLAQALAFVCFADGSETLFWVDAHVTLQPHLKRISNWRKKIYVPVTASMKDRFEALTREDFLRFIAPQLVDDELDGSAHELEYYAEYPDRLRVLIRGEWLIETDHFSVVSTTNSGGRDCLASLAKAQKYLIAQFPDEPRESMIQRLMMETRLCRGRGDLERLYRSLGGSQEAE